MSKAVLVMDMPDSCLICPFCNEDVACLAMDNSSIDVDVVQEKPDWCPIRQMPEKKQEEVPVAYTHFGAYNDGCNACIDAIIGN